MAQASWPGEGWQAPDLAFFWLPGFFLEMGQDKNKVVWTIRELCTQADLMSKVGR